MRGVTLLSCACFFLLTVGFLLSTHSTEYFHVMGGFFKGSEYLDLNAQRRAAYAAGFVNGMSVAAAGTKRW